MSRSRLVRLAVPLAIGLAFLVPAIGVAQDLQYGDRIRVTAPSYPLNREVGQLLLLDTDSLVFEAAADRRWTVPRELLTDLEVSAGQRRHAGRGFLIGAGVGLVVGGLGLLASGEDCSGDNAAGFLCTVVVAGSTAGGGLLGLFVGGAVVRTERWVPVPLGGR